MEGKKLVLLALLFMLTGLLVLTGCSPRQDQPPASEEVVTACIRGSCNGRGHGRISGG